jgi:hypothetical protein
MKVDESRPARTFPLVRLGFRLPMLRVGTLYFALECGPGVDQHPSFRMTMEKQLRIPERACQADL